MKKPKKSPKKSRRILIGILTIMIAISSTIAYANYDIEKTAFFQIFPAPYYDEAMESEVTPPETYTALVLGAKVRADGQPSDMLKDRLDTTLALYQKGIVRKIIASGDHGQTEYDEVNSMKNYLLAHDVRAEDLFLDHAGFDTYDSIYRAQAIFQVKSLTIITQEFHLPRAIYIGEKIGIPKVQGVIADKQPYQHMTRVKIREELAQLKAFLNITFHSNPKYLGDQIPITGDSRLSWD